MTRIEAVLPVERTPAEGTGNGSLSAKKPRTRGFAEMGLAWCIEMTSLNLRGLQDQPG
ncbi:MAG TPA: hypothetical protein VKU00_01675 [Chthonomonadaceae bacterium]|nr:hypothetical protein [Chthonomonadaceae bacterium]